MKMSGTLQFPDIASFQGGINFSSSYAVIAKATEGLNYVNPEYQAFKAQAEKEHVYFAAYHFLHHGNAAAQCDHYVNTVGHGVPGMLDVEPTTGQRPTIGDAVEFLHECNKRGVAMYLLYLPHWYWQQLGSPVLTELRQIHQRLCASDYTTYSDNGVGWQPYGGLDVAVWQHASDVNYGGVFPVDFNAFKGSGGGSVTATLAEFKTFMETGVWPG
jgi:lysozyme